MNSNFPVRRESFDIIRSLVESGQVDLARLREVKRGQKKTDRVEHHKDKTVYESTTETVEIYFFD